MSGYKVNAIELHRAKGVEDTAPLQKANQKKFDLKKLIGNSCFTERPDVAALFNTRPVAEGFSSA